MAFAINHTVDLGQYGWDGCQIILQSTPYKELAQLQQKFANADPNDPAIQAASLDMLKSKFISGSAMDDGKKVSITAEQIEDLPVEIVIYCVQSLFNIPQPSPN